MYYFSTRHQSTRECNETSKREIIDERHRYSYSEKLQYAKLLEKLNIVLSVDYCSGLTMYEFYEKEEMDTPWEDSKHLYAALHTAYSNKFSDHHVLCKFRKMISYFYF